MTRIERLKRRRNKTFFENIFRQRKDIYYRVFKEYKKEPKIIRKARALAAFLQEKDIILQEDDLIAGYQQPYDFSEPIEEPDLYALYKEDKISTIKTYIEWPARYFNKNLITK